MKKILLSLMLSGCGAMFTTNHVRVHSDMDGVKMDGYALNGEHGIQVSTLIDHKITFEGGGTCTLVSHPHGGIVILDLLALLTPWGLFSLPTDLATGDWNELETSDCRGHIKLTD